MLKLYMIVKLITYRILVSLITLPTSPPKVKGDILFSVRIPFASAIAWQEWLCAKKSIHDTCSLRSDLQGHIIRFLWPWPFKGQHMKFSFLRSAQDILFQNSVPGDCGEISFVVVLLLFFIWYIYLFIFSSPEHNVLGWSASVVRRPSCVVHNLLQITSSP